MVLNTLTAWPQRGKVRFASVDFNPPAGRQLVLIRLRERCALAMDSGLLQHFFAGVESDKWDGWHACVAKNTAHMAGVSLPCGSDVVLVNLDGDNLITSEFIEYVLDYADEMTKQRVGGVSPTVGGVSPTDLPRVVGLTCKHPSMKSTTGRICVGGKVFLHLRGYDESFWSDGSCPNA